MAKRTVWTCDRCGHSENVVENQEPKERGFYTLNIVVQKQPMGPKFERSRRALWCEDCCKATRVVSDKAKPGEVPVVQPGIEDLIREIATEAVEDAMQP